MKVFNTSFTLSSEERTEVSDVTKLVRDAIQQLPISAGIALINTLHTTCALFINEFQSALIDDLKRLIERLVPERDGYRHDDPRSEEHTSELQSPSNLVCRPLLEQNRDNFTKNLLLTLLLLSILILGV